MFVKNIHPNGKRLEAIALQPLLAETRYQPERRSMTKKSAGQLPVQKANKPIGPTSISISGYFSTRRELQLAKAESLAG